VGEDCRQNHRPRKGISLQKRSGQALLVALKKAKPTQAKGVYIKKVSISTTMGAGVAVDQAA
jgi:hypothetical protein